MNCSGHVLREERTREKGSENVGALEEFVCQKVTPILAEGNSSSVPVGVDSPHRLPVMKHVN